MEAVIEASEARKRIEELLATNGLRTVFHPIVDLTTRKAIGYEALARFPDEGERPVGAWFGDATAAGMRAELEVAAIHAAVRAATLLPAGAFVAFNVSPATAVEVDLRGVLAPLPLHLVVLDVNEDAALEELEEFGKATEELRRDGMRLAIDDAGEGFVSLRHVVGLSPDIIKIGLEICRGIEANVVSQAVASALCAFASRMGAVTIAEGIETEEELSELASLGVACGQGYLFGRPQPAETFSPDSPAD